jgi:phospholipid/cholesterol/gamma-HCH transport system ATP-binding protein
MDTKHQTPTPLPDNSPLIEFRDLTFGYGARAILDGVTFSVPRGKVTALMGA